MNPKPISTQGLRLQQPQEPGYLGQAAEFGKGLASKAVEGALRIPELPTRALDWLTQNPNPEVPPISPPREYPSEYIPEKIFGRVKEPENPLGRAAYTTAASLPLELPLAIATGGGSLLGTAARTAGRSYAGSLAMEAVEPLGLEEHYPITNAALKVGANILGETGFNAVSNFLNKVPKKPTQIMENIGRLYKKESELGSKIPVKQQDIDRVLEDFHTKVSGIGVHKDKFPQSAKSRVLENIALAKNKPYNTAAELFEGKKFANDLYLSGDSKEARLMGELKKVFSKPLDELATKHHDWGKSWKLADELYQIEKWQLPFNKILTDLSNSKNPFSKVISSPFMHSVTSLLTQAAFSGFGLGTAYAAGGGLAIKGAAKATEEALRAARFLNAFKKTPEGQKILWEIAANSVKRDVPKVAYNLNKVAKNAEKYEDNDGAMPISTKGLRLAS